MPVRSLAAALVALEGIGLAALAAWQVVALTGGDTDDLGTALALVVLTLIGAAALVAFAVAIHRGRSWGRSGGIVAQLLILAVALGALTGETSQPVAAALIAAPALVGLVLLVLTVRQAAPARSED